MAPVLSIAARFSPLLRAPVSLQTPDGTPLSPSQIGTRGEKTAARFLQAQGWQVLARNYRARYGGEADLVMRGEKARDTLIFVEVKTRTRTHGRPLDAVDSHKLQLLERAANGWLRELGHRRLPWRIDVVEVLLTEGQPPALTLVRDLS